MAIGETPLSAFNNTIKRKTRKNLQEKNQNHNSNVTNQPGLKGTSIEYDSISYSYEGVTHTTETPFVPSRCGFGPPGHITGFFFICFTDN